MQHPPVYYKANEPCSDFNERRVLVPPYSVLNLRRTKNSLLCAILYSYSIIRLQLGLEHIQETADPVWEELDQKFFTYEDDLNTLNIEFVRKNKDKY